MACPACGAVEFHPVFEKAGLRLVKCGSCTLVQVDDPQGNFNIANYDYYRSRLNRGMEASYNPITTKRYKDLLAKMQVYRKNNQLLDIGCGEGHFLWVAKQMGWQAKGVEIAAWAVEVCKKFSVNAERVDLLKADLLPETFDLVAMHEVLEHLVSPTDYLRKVHVLLRKGGVLFITTPNFNCVSRRILRKNWSLVHCEHLFYYTSFSLKKLLVEAGFRVISLKSKNINIPELLSFSQKRKTLHMHEYNRWIRESAERNFSLSSLRVFANGLLNLAGLGETLECLCQKE